MPLRDPVNHQNNVKKRTAPHPPEPPQALTLEGTTVNNGEFRIGRLIGRGSFGCVYHCERRNDPTQRYAIKVEPLPPHRKDGRVPVTQLACEYDMYATLHSPEITPGVLRAFWYGEENGFAMLVLDRLGPSVEELFNFCGRSFSIKTVVMLGDQMFRRLEAIHAHGVIHRDIKPDNFLIGYTNGMVYAVDFGLAKRWVRNGVHIPYRDGKNLVGTARYVSQHTHDGIESARRDDIESVVYVLIYLLRGSLPWQGMRLRHVKKRADDKTDPAFDRHAKIRLKKASTPDDLLCKGLPREMLALLRYARGLQFEETPDYEHIYGVLRGLFMASGFHYDLGYDWTLNESARRARNHEPILIENTPESVEFMNKQDILLAAGRPLPSAQQVHQQQRQSQSGSRTRSGNTNLASTNNTLNDNSNKGNHKRHYYYYNDNDDDAHGDDDNDGHAHYQDYGNGYYGDETDGDDA